MPVYGIDKSNINDALSAMTSIIYNYFCDTCGVLEVTDASHLDEKYKKVTNSSLQRQLKNLKRSNTDLAEIRYVAKLLRSKLKDCSKQHSLPIDHDQQIQRNFWGYVKSNFKKSTSSSPSFDIFACVTYFQDFFRPINPSKCFKIPNWIPPLADPSKPYDLSPPSYHQVTKVIRDEGKIRKQNTKSKAARIGLVSFPLMENQLKEEFLGMRREGKSVKCWWFTANAKQILKQLHPNEDDTFRFSNRWFEGFVDEIGFL